MLKNEFEEKEAIVRCKKCKRNVSTTRRKRVITTPNELLIVVDRFDSKGVLRKLLPTVPEELDLAKYLNNETADEGTITKYEISAFICQDPQYLDYSVYVKSEKLEDDEEEWTLFNKRGKTKVWDEDLFEEKTLHDNKANHDA